MSSPDHTPRPHTSLRSAWLPMTGLAAVFLVEMLDNSILNVALPTIGRDLGASSASLQFVTLTYSVVFGGLMIALGGLADRFGRRRMMFVGLAILATASLSVLLVSEVWQLIAIRAVTGVAAAMTAPGTMALAFRLFDTDEQRVRGMNIIATVGLIGMAVGPVAGGLMLSVAPWQALIAVNTPIALLAMVAIAKGIPVDRPSDLHHAPIDITGSLLGTIAIMSVMLVPTAFAETGAASPLPWLAVAGAVTAAVFFVVRERLAPHPLIELSLISRPLVASGLLFKAAASLAIGALGYLVTLHLQLALGWSPTQAALGMLPQVIVLIGGGALVTPLVARIGMTQAARYASTLIVAGLAVYGLLGTRSYLFVALALTLVAAGMRVVAVVAGTNVMRGLPENRTTVGAALADTAGQVGTAAGLALAGTTLTALFSGVLAASSWSPAQYVQFDLAITVAGCVLAAVAAVLVGVGVWLSRKG